MHRSTFHYSYADRRIIKRNILFGVFGFVLSMVLFYLFAGNVVRPLVVRNESMIPTFQENEYYIASFAGFQQSVLDAVSSGSTVSLRGMPVLVRQSEQVDVPFLSDIVDKVVGFVTFQFVRPYSDRNHIRDTPYLRRLVGFPGDEIYMENFMLYIKPSGEDHFLTEFELTSTDYDIAVEKLPLNWSDAMPFSGTHPTITLGANEYFVLADNRSSNLDSRYWGAVPLSALQGSVRLRVFPFSRFGLVD